MAKDIFIKVRTTKEQRDRWAKAACLAGKDISRVMRESLDRFAARVEKRNSEDQK